MNGPLLEVGTKQSEALRAVGRGDMALWPIFNLFLSNGCLEISVIFQYR